MLIPVSDQIWHFGESTAKVTSGARWICFVQNNALSATSVYSCALRLQGKLENHYLRVYVCVYLYNTYTPVCNYRFVCAGET